MTTLQIIIFFAFMILVDFLIMVWLNNRTVGELQIDTEHEIVQIAFHDIENLHKTVTNKNFARFRVVHKHIPYQQPQEKQGL